ncbi:MAG: hypothetical protein R3E12_03700 [Candidatus Eisenbacteria bacterium]
MLCAIGTAGAWAAQVAPSYLERSTDQQGFHPTINQPPASAGTNIVNLNTSESFMTIQDAIDAPNTLDGHVIEVQTPTFSEGIVDVNKGVTIQGHERRFHDQRGREYRLQQGCPGLVPDLRGRRHPS